jgi:hypothetical protein
MATTTAAPPQVDAPYVTPPKPSGWSAVLAAQGVTLVFVVTTAYAFGKQLGEINTQLATLNNQVATLSDPNNGAIARLIKIETRMEPVRPQLVPTDTTDLR